ICANEMHSDRVTGLSPEESEAVLAEVFAILYGADNVYAHEWRVGDLILWDNVALQHGRPDFPETEERTLQRVSVGNKTALELVPNLADLLAARERPS